MMRAALLSVLLLGQAAANYHCCSAGEPRFLGTYKEDGEQDGAPKFTNSNGMTVFRNNGFWYMGDMVEWPPKTFYRCVEGCASGTATPPLKATRRPRPSASSRRRSSRRRSVHTMSSRGVG